MSREINIPVTTLAGISNLTDLLLVFPLPSNETDICLIDNGQQRDDCNLLLHSTDVNHTLLNNISKVLQSTSIDHIVLNDDKKVDRSINSKTPYLLKNLTSQHPNIFSRKQPVKPFPTPTVNGGAYPSTKPHASPYQAGHISPGTPHSPKRSTAAVTPAYPQPASLPSKQASITPAIIPNLTVKQEVNTVVKNGKIESSQTSLKNDKIPIESIVKKDVKPITSEIKRPDYKIAEIISRGFEKELIENEMKEKGEFSSPNTPLNESDSESKSPRHRHRSKAKDRGYNVVSKEQATPGLTLKLSITKPKDTSEPSDNAVECQKESERPSCTERLQPDPSPTQESTPAPKTSSKRRRETVSYKDEDSDAEKNPNPPSERREGKRDRNHRHHSSDVREKKRKRDHDKHGKSEHRRSHKSSRRRRHSRRRSSSSPNNNNNSASTEYIRAFVNIDDSKCSSRIAMGTGGAGVSGPGGVQDDGPSESTVLHRFNANMDEMLAEVEDVDLSIVYGHEEDEDVFNEPLVSKNSIRNLLNETSKLNSLGAANKVPYEKLVRLLALLQFSIKDGCRSNAYKSTETSKEKERNKEAMERILCAADSSLIALNIMTSKNMPKQVYLEDTIERIVGLAKKHLTAIYPEYDSIYRVNKEVKEFDPNYKARQCRSSNNNISHSTIKLYHKLIEIVRLLALLSKIQILTDTTVLQLSSLSVAPFFVENISELQLSALKLISSVFSHYEKHRQLILDDILSSLSRLSSSKNKLRNYRLNADESIQMVTALVLQLIQCVVKLPKDAEDDDKANENESKIDHDIIISNSYEKALKTSHVFLCVFLRKCSTKGENDFRPLFENFVYDLLSTVNRPEWPAAELLLSLLGRLLVKQFSDKTVDMSLRVASLDYLGIVAARLRKDSITNHHSDKVIQDIIDQEKKTRGEKYKLDETECLQAALAKYLISSSTTNESVEFSRNFYLAQWFRDCSATMNSKKPQASASSNGNKRSMAGDLNEHSEDGDDSEDEDGDTKEDRENRRRVVAELAKNTKLREQAETRRQFILLTATQKKTSNNLKSDQSSLTHEDACMVSRYLAATRPFSRSFDIYLSQILKVLSETAVAVRTKAMKCLTAVIEADPLILAREDMKQGVKARFHDNSTSVREAAVELIGKFILIRPDLTPQYYDMLSNRILDTGISVRKRVIRIFRDICLDQPDFPKIPEMCVRMIRRVNDEDGIKKLVNNTFQLMWFSETSDEQSSALSQRVAGITDVVTLCKDFGLDWFEQLLENLLDSDKGKEDKPIESACSRVVNCLVNTMLNSTSKTQGEVNTRLVSCFQTLNMFCKVRPNLLTYHSDSIQTYLNIKCTSHGDIVVIQSVSKILEKCVPLIKHPSDVFLETLESSLMNIVLRNNSAVLTDSVSCLASIVLSVTFNYKLIKDLFERLFGVISSMIFEHKKNGASDYYNSNQSNLLRSLYTSGLFCRWFNFDDTEKFGSYKSSIRDRIFNSLLYWVSNENERVRHRALSGLGFFLTRDYEYMLRDEMKSLYRDLLASNNDLDNDMNVKLRCQVLQNLHMYLQEEENRMLMADIEFKKNSKKEDLKQMGDVQSGMASTVVQLYINSICESFFHINLQQRQTTLKVITLILKQGLVHPVNLVPYLASVSTDNDMTIRSLANQQLNELDKKYPNFIQGKALAGIRESLRLQTILQRSNVDSASSSSATPTKDNKSKAKSTTSSSLIRGYRVDSDGIVVGLNSYIYGLIRGNRSQRRALVQSLLHCFDQDIKSTDSISVHLSKLVYMSDVLTSLPFQVHDEPLFVIHQIDLIVSVYGSNVLQQFVELFFPEKKNIFEDEDVDAKSLYDHLPDNVQPLCNQLISAQQCLLLIKVKTHVKETYGFTDVKLQRYSPSEPVKVWDKPLHRKISKTPFGPPDCVLTRIRDTGDLAQRCNHCGDDAIKTRKSLIHEYLDFKQLMLTIDPDDDFGDEPSATATTTSATTTTATSAGTTAVNPASTNDQEPDVNYHEDGDHIGALVRPSGLSSQMRMKQRRTASHHHQHPQRSSGSHTTPKKKTPTVKKKHRRRYQANDYSDDSNDSDYCI